MNQDLLESEGLLARTAAGTAELNRPANALSVPQRKLLLLIQNGIDYRTLRDSGPSADRDRRDRDLARLIELGLAIQVDADGKALPSRVEVPVTRFEPATGIGAATGTDSAEVAGRPPGMTATYRPQTKKPMIAGFAVAGALLIGGLSWLGLRDGQESAPPGAPAPAQKAAVAATVMATPSIVQVSMPAPGSVSPAPSLASVSASIAPAAGPQPAAPGRSADTQSTAKKELVPAAANPAKGTVPPARSEPPGTKAAPAAVNVPPPAVAMKTETVAADSAARPAPPAVVPPPQNVAANNPPPPAAQPAPAATSAPTLPSVAPTLASAAPTAAAPTIAPAPRIVTRVNPDFPVEAAREGIAAGTVRARMQVGADGGVTRVEILQSTPPRVFDRAVTRALSQWKFEPTGQARAVDFEVDFKLAAN